MAAEGDDDVYLIHKKYKGGFSVVASSSTDSDVPSATAVDAALLEMIVGLNPIGAIPDMEIPGFSDSNLELIILGLLHVPLFYSLNGKQRHTY